MIRLNLIEVVLEGVSVAGGGVTKYRLLSRSVSGCSRMAKVQVWLIRVIGVIASMAVTGIVTETETWALETGITARTKRPRSRKSRGPI